MIDITEEVNNGVFYKHFRIKKWLPAIFSYGNKRIKITGYPKISIMMNSYKYGNELQLTLSSPKESIIPLVEEERNISNWNTSEINLPIKDGIDLLESVLDFLKNQKEVTA